MPFPKVGDMIDTEKALELCEFFRFSEVAEHIKQNPELFKSWEFDGASMTPDRFFSKTFKIPNLIKISLKHDIKYAYGNHGDKKARMLADIEFYSDLVADNCDIGIASAMFNAVRVFGSEESKTSFGWGFAHV